MTWILAVVIILLVVLIPVIILAISDVGEKPGGRIDLGRTELKEPDSELMIKTVDWGTVPANQFLLLMQEGRGLKEAEAAASAVGGRVVGEIEYVQLFQVEYPGQTEKDLKAAVKKAGGVEGVEAAFPDGEAAMRDAPGQECGPMNDPLYQEGNNGRAYEMTGLPDAWRLLKAARCEAVGTNGVHVGIVDEPLVQWEKNPNAYDLRVVADKNSDARGEVKVYGLSEADVENNPELNHGTEVTQLICADWDNGGVTGGASILEDKLTVSVAAPEGTFSGVIESTEKQIEDGATIINLSLGPSTTGSQNEKQAAAMRAFLGRLAREHPEILLVAAAGNTGDALNGKNDWWGLDLPNLITVGALDNEGNRALWPDWDGESSFAGKGGEVTLAAPGTGVFVGTTWIDDGKPVVADGTSFAAPQVTAAAALIRSIDPTLTAAEIKQILVDSGADTVKSGGKKVNVPTEVGGKVLRVDNAVLDAVNGVRRKRGQSELTREQLLPYGRVSLKASGGPLQYQVTASLDTVSKGGTELRIDVVSGACDIEGDTERSLSDKGSLTWKVTKRSEKDEVLVKVTRLDSLACARVRLASSPAGTYLGRLTIVEDAPTGQTLTYELDITVVIDENNGAAIYFSGSGNLDIDAGGTMVTASFTVSGQLSGRLEENLLSAAGSGTSNYTANIPGYGDYSSSQPLEVSASGSLVREGRLEGNFVFTNAPNPTAASWWAEKQP